ncbi:RNA-directed DNA polymerase [Eisenbergiella tayi]|uniref:RNA-directed DNA polymerase n=1 Tax=Eisenbergiella tayi TaxID=1432052 RepID=UPI000849344F|nr:RNA-directed DNA polymerase [Eisenbergiella tayi]ODR33154.1 hypothetical protein BEI60_26330 [Eisenbergiella tayi]
MDLEKSVELAIRNVMKEGLTDIFARPFEVDLLSKSELFKKRIYDETIRSIRSGSVSGLGINAIDYMLMPKNIAFGFRKCALIQPHDTIKYLALVLTLAETIEKARVPISQKRVYSYRFHPNNGYLWNKNYTITAFRNRVSEKAKQKKTNLIVSCDIANYYERLNLHRLQNTLLSINCNRNIVNLINELLLFWSNRDSYGLPVGSNASRILSEANLIGVDNYLLSMGVDFIRYVDDYRFFAPNASVAHYWLTVLIDRLGQEGLSINMSKTKIEPNDRYMHATEVHTKTKKEKDEKNPFIIKAGYGGTVPTNFRKPSNSEKERLEVLNIESLLESAKINCLVESSEFIEIIKACIVQRKYSMLVEILAIINKYLQLTPYYIDTLIKHQEFFTHEDVEKINIYFTKQIKESRFIPEYLMVSYIRLFGSDYFSNKKFLIEQYRNLRRDSGAYIGRVLLDALYGLANREDMLEIRKSFSRSNLWEKRQIIRLIDSTFDEEEKRPWLKNIRQIEPNELFLLETAEPTKLTKKKKRRKK